LKILRNFVFNFAELPTQFPCSFSVWISSDGGKTLKQVNILLINFHFLEPNSYFNQNFLDFLMFIKNSIFD